MEQDFEAEFSKLVEGLGELANTEIAVSLHDVSLVVERLNEAALYLGKYVSKVISEPRGTPVDFPEELVAILPPLAALCDQTTDLIHDYVCGCMNECDCEEEEDCENCRLDDDD
jgi:hypothetical protein